jgi:signal transduction histidine kinase
VTVKETDAPGDLPVIEVRDRAAGMSEAFPRRKLFKPYETTPPPAGMGIGPYQAREIVRALGG